MENKPNYSMKEITAREGILTAEPLPRGYGATLANSLRRVLLSSLPGCAAIAVRVRCDGLPAIHEFSTLPGMQEDVTELILNIKAIVAKLHGIDRATATLEFSGPGEILAGHLRCGSELEIINPELHLAQLGEAVTLTMELDFAGGVGYIPSDRNQALYPDLPLGSIYVDSVFTPVLNVNFDVENARIGSSMDYDKMTLRLLTDGSISPTDAVAQAGRILIGHYQPLADLGQEEEIKITQPEKAALPSGGTDINIDDLDLSVRSYNCLRRAGLDTVADIIRLSEGELMQIRNLGRKSYEEILEKLDSMNLHLQEA